MLLAAVALVLSSPAFANGASIPVRYTCAGADVSPPLHWSAPPAGTRNFRLTMVDATAGFTHWRASGIPASARGLATGAHAPHEGANDFGRRGWGGPCPPRGGPHTYVFTLEALGARGQVLARARLAGRYATE